MSLTTIPYQPLPFDLEENCTLPCVDWIQKIERQDVTSVQFNYGACGTSWTILTNGDFAGGGSDWTQFGTWSFSGGVATSPVSTNGRLRQTFEQTTADYFELSFYCTVNNGYLNIYNGTGWYEYTQRDGYHTYVFDTASTTEINFFFSEALGGTISNIQLRPINANIRLDVTDLDGNVEATVPTSMFTYSDGFFTANIDDWDSLLLDDGCYKLAIYDPCECSQFGFVGDDFKTANQWRTIAGSVAIGGGAMQFKTPFQTQVRSRALLCPDTQYEINYTLSGMQGGDDFQVRIGSTNGTLRTTDGSYTETLSTNFTGDIEVRFIVNHNGLPHTIELTDFSIEAVTPVIAYTSVPFNLKDDHKCTVLVSACGNGDQFNFGFGGTGFNPLIRLEGTYRTSNYPTVKTGYEYSNGLKKVSYMRTRQAKSLLFGAPEYVHDFARLWLGFDNVYIDGALMSSEDDEYPSMSLEEDLDFGIVTMTFSKQELTEKRSCSALPDIGCTDEGFEISIFGTGGLVRPDEPTLSATDGRKLKFG
jgi:hypothetical protein